MSRRAKSFLFAALFAGALPASALACATCYGASDSPMAQGMNWGIASLLGVVLSVLAGVTMFFVHIGRRSAQFNAAEANPVQTDKIP